MKTLATMCSLVAGLLSLPALADEHGCKVLLCLADPSGPKAQAECVEDINRLYHDLHRGRPFPRCEMAQSSDAGQGAYAAQGLSYYDPCPEGTAALPEQSYAIQGSLGTTMFRGIGEGSGTGLSFADETMPGKVCVGAKLGDTWFVTGSGEMEEHFVVGVYDRVVLLDPYSSPNIIDVFIGSELYRRVRY